MGGKSTLLRQTCIGVIMAQLGAYVPAESCNLTAVDRIFTRVGATDRLLAGQSTFFVELTETSMILRAASRSSLVILDELGRGTSTFDGNAIAYAVVQHLTRAVGCRTMFATHYHSLCEEFERNPDVRLGHMACVVEEEHGGGGGGDSGAPARVTFLYRFQDGACPKSYGLNVARLATLPPALLARAKEVSEEFEAALEASVHHHEGGAATRIAADVARACAQGDGGYDAVLAAWDAAALSSGAAIVSE